MSNVKTNNVITGIIVIALILISLWVYGECFLFAGEIEREGVPHGPPIVHPPENIVVKAGETESRFFLVETQSGVKTVGNVSFGIYRTKYPSLIEPDNPELESENLRKILEEPMPEGLKILVDSLTIKSDSRKEYMPKLTVETSQSLMGGVYWIGWQILFNGKIEEHLKTKIIINR